MGRELSINVYHSVEYIPLKIKEIMSMGFLLLFCFVFLI